MPSYIVTVERPVMDVVAPGAGDPQTEAYRVITGAPVVRQFRRDVITRAVATLEEAREDVAVAVRTAFDSANGTWRPFEADALPESGGTVGPLPGGERIRVEPIRSDGPDPRRAACPLIFTSEWLRMSEQERCDAFNAAQAEAA